MTGVPSCADRPANAEPPDDAEEWTHEQWLEWLRASDHDAAAVNDGDAVAPRPLGGAGVVLRAAMLGLHDAIFGPADDVDVVYVNEADGRDNGWRVELVPDDPSRSHVIVPDSRRSAPESDEV